MCQLALYKFYFSVIKILNSWKTLLVRKWCSELFHKKKLVAGVPALDILDHPSKESQLFFGPLTPRFGKKFQTTHPQNFSHTLSCVGVWQSHPPTESQNYPDHPPPECFRRADTPTTNFSNGIASSRPESCSTTHFDVARCKPFLHKTIRPASFTLKRFKVLYFGPSRFKSFIFSGKVL